MTFDEAKTVLLEPYALTPEDRDVVGEQRFVNLGMGVMDRIVVWTLLGETVRLISAWKAKLPPTEAL